MSVGIIHNILPSLHILGIHPFENNSDPEMIVPKQVYDQHIYPRLANYYFTCSEYNAKTGNKTAFEHLTFFKYQIQD